MKSIVQSESSELLTQTFDICKCIQIITCNLYLSTFVMCANKLHDILKQVKKSFQTFNKSSPNQKRHNLIWEGGGGGGPFIPCTHLEMTTLELECIGYYKWEWCIKLSIKPKCNEWLLVWFSWFVHLLHKQKMYRSCIINHKNQMMNQNQSL